MKLKSLALATALTVASFGAQAAALMYTVDDFSVSNPTLVGPGTTTSTAAPFFNSRTVVTSAVSGPIGVSRVESFGSALDLTNSASIDSTKKVTWAWSPTLIALFANATNVQLTLAVYSESDPSNSNTASPSPIGGVINSGATSLVFNVGTLGASYGIEFNGNPGWDLTLQALTISGDCKTGYAAGTGGNANTCVQQSQVPLPGSVALLGLGLVGLAGLRRRG